MIQPGAVKWGLCALRHGIQISMEAFFWLATQRDPRNDWTATQNRVNYGVFAQAPLFLWRHWKHLNFMHSVTSENQFHFTRLYATINTIDTKKLLEIEKEIVREVARGD